jgi:uncharacterized protein (DUF58 family)
LRPARPLIRLVGACALAAPAALVFPLLTAPVWGVFLVVMVLAAIDWTTSRHDSAPELERILPAHPVKDRPATIRYRIRRPEGASTIVDLLDELPEAIGGDLSIAGVELRRGQSAEVSRELIPNRRGTFSSGPTFMLWRSHLGFFRLRIRIAAPEQIVIRPGASVPQRSAGLNYRALREELGLRPRPLRGEGREFESLREYVPGDDPRHIDWRASARHARLQVRQFQTERRHTVVVAMDTGRLMAAYVDGTSKLDHAINCAAALARASIAYGDRVGFLAFDRELRLLARPRSGRAGVGTLVEATSDLQPASFEPDYRILVETLTRNQKKRALIVVLTDLVEGGASREQENYLAVLARRHCVMLVALRDRMLHELDEPAPAISREQLYRRLALQDLVAERETAMERIARFGAHVLDLDPAMVTAPVLNRYLAIRDTGLS